MTATAILGCGAWLKNAACLWTPDTCQWSAPHGDLGTPEACEALTASVSALLEHAAASGLRLAAVAHDLHPDFFSSQLAVATAAEQGVPAIAVQHHRAHLAAVVAEHGIDGPVVGWALDGVGLGSDGAAWGGELLLLDAARWSRLGHLQPLALPGGDRAASEPWRMAASVLSVLGRDAEIVTRFAPVVGAPLAQGIQQLLATRLNCPPTSSTGRWFDAAAAALGLCVHRQQHEAQAAMTLEAAAARALRRSPKLAPLSGARRTADGQVELAALLAQLFDASDVEQAAAGFHLALADALADALIAAANRHATRTAVLGGGCFFNTILRERLVSALSAAGLRVHWPLAHSCGDAGLALGQAWVAAQELADADSHAPISTPFFEESIPCA